MDRADADLGVFFHKPGAGRQEALFQSPQGDERFQGPGRTERMARQALGTPEGRIGQQAVEGTPFDPVVLPGPCTVDIDEGKIAGIDPGLPEGFVDGGLQTTTFRVGLVK